MSGTVSKDYSQYYGDGANIDANFGPWDSTSQYITWLTDTFGRQTPKDGTLIAVNDGTGNLNLKIYQYGEWKDAVKTAIICDGGLLQNGGAPTVMGKKYLSVSGGKICKVSYRIGSNTSVEDCEIGKIYVCEGKVYYFDGSECKVMGGGLTYAQEQNLTSVINASVTQAQDIAELKQKVQTLARLEGTNFFGFYDTYSALNGEIQDGTIDENGWALVGELDNLTLYDVIDGQAYDHDNMQYDFTDYLHLDELVKLIASTVQDGWFVADKDGKVAMKYTADGLDFAKISTHAVQVLNSAGIQSSSSSQSTTTGAVTEEQLRTAVVNYLSANMKYLKIGNKYYSTINGIPDRDTQPTYYIDVISLS